MLSNTLTALLLLVAAILSTTSDASAQRRPSGPETVQVVPVQRNARPRHYVKVVQVPGPARHYRDGRADTPRNYLFFSRGGYDRNRAAAAQWNARFRPVPVLRPVVSFPGRYSRYRGGQPRVYRRW